MEAKVLGMGNALVDILVRIPNDNILHQFNMPRGSMQLVDAPQSAEIYRAIQNLEPQKVAGGSSSNTINGLANLGIATGMIGKIGKDELGQFFLDDLKKSGIDPHMFTSESPTGNCIALISPDSERTFATCLGAAIEMSAEDILPSLFEGYTHFYVEGYLVQNYELIETSLKIAHEKGLLTCIDLASYNVVEENLDFLKKIIKKYVDVVFANQEEATAFTGKEDLEALNELGELADIIVMKQGRKGCIIKYNDIIERVGIIKANGIDTTGAGDMFAAGFLYGMINDFTPNKCAQAGSILAGNVIEVIGTKMDTQRWNRIRQSLKKLKN